MADKVFRIDDSGNFVPCEPTNTDLLTRDFDNEITVEIPHDESKECDAMVFKPDNKSNGTDVLRITDRKVYKTYFSSFGRNKMIIFLIGGAAFAFTLKFPGMSPVR